MAKCFSCNFILHNAVEAEMHYQGISKNEAIKNCAKGLSIDIEEKSKKEEDRTRAKPGTFAYRQLKASGLEPSDVVAYRYDQHGKRIKGEPGLNPFVTGGVKPGWVPSFMENEMLIFYYDLQGNIVKYATKGAAGRPKQFFRVRWSNPEEKIDKTGRPAKYMSPKGASVCFYIPEFIRAKFNAEEEIETLIVQEGEKKAEKACKHGIPSIGIQGIFNIGNDQGLPRELQYIVEKCKVKNIVLLFDSDWDAISPNIKNGDDADLRPKMFAMAAVKFRKYLRTLNNINLPVDAFFGHIKENEAGDKGIDDLLVNTLKGKEDQLWPDFSTAMNHHKGQGQWVDVHNISTIAETKIYDFWDLNDKDKFFARHSEELKDLKYFKFSGVQYCHDDEGFKIDNFAGKNEKFWETETDEKGKSKVIFHARTALQFLEANGFRILAESMDDSKSNTFIKIDDKVLDIVTSKKIREFTSSFVYKTTKSLLVHDYFIMNISRLLAEDKLEHMQAIDPDEFVCFEPTRQKICFANSRYYISADGLTPCEGEDYVWRSVIIDHELERIQLIEDINFDPDKGWKLSFNPKIEDCEFFRFLRNTCNFFDHKPIEEFTEEERSVMAHHLANKLSSLGFLMVDRRDRAVEKAIVAMDAKMSEVNKSCGRSGKSFIGLALSYFKKQTFIDGRSTEQDKHFFTGVDRDTRMVVIDDIKINFDFTKLYPAITANMVINNKYGSIYTIDYYSAPKIYITTNHALNIKEESTLDRINFMLFSDYYSTRYNPMKEFGHRLFDDWENEQWNLFYNLMIDCVIWYYRLLQPGSWGNGGLVAPPMEQIEARTERQDIGEAFLDWADTFFHPESSNINTRLVRKEVQDAYFAENPGQIYKISSRVFSQKLKTYCQFRHLDFNIFKKDPDGISFLEFVQHSDRSFIGDRDTANGKEYITVCTRDFALTQRFS